MTPYQEYHSHISTSLNQDVSKIRIPPIYCAYASIWATGSERIILEKKIILYAKLNSIFLGWSFMTQKMKFIFLEGFVHFRPRACGVGQRKCDIDNFLVRTCWHLRRRSRSTTTVWVSACKNLISEEMSACDVPSVRSVPPLDAGSCGKIRDLKPSFVRSSVNRCIAVGITF